MVYIFKIQKYRYTWVYFTNLKAIWEREAFHSKLTLKVLWGEWKYNIISTEEINKLHNVWVIIYKTDGHKTIF